MKKLILILLFSLSLISALPNDAGNSIDFTYSTPINYTAVNTNNSIYWQGHTGTDGSWLTGISTANDSYVLKIGDTMTGNLTINSNSRLGFNTISPNGTIHINRTLEDHHTPSLLISGTSLAGSGSNDSRGYGFYLSYNLAGNRQFVFANTETGTGFRFIGSSIDGYNVYSSQRTDTVIGTPDHGVHIGYNGVNTGYADSQFEVNNRGTTGDVGNSSKVIMSIRAAEGQSEDILRISKVNSTLGDLMTINENGSVGILTPATTNSLEVNGSTRIRETLSLVSQDGTTSTDITQNGNSPRLAFTTANIFYIGKTGTNLGNFVKFDGTTAQRTDVTIPNGTLTVTNKCTGLGVNCGGTSNKRLYVYNTNVSAHDDSGLMALFEYTRGVNTNYQQYATGFLLTSNPSEGNTLSWDAGALDVKAMHNGAGISGILRGANYKVGVAGGGLTSELTAMQIWAPWEWNMGNNPNGTATTMNGVVVNSATGGAAPTGTNVTIGTYYGERLFSPIGNSNYFKLTTSYGEYIHNHGNSGNVTNAYNQYIEACSGSPICYSLYVAGGNSTINGKLITQNVTGDNLNITSNLFVGGNMNVTNNISVKDSIEVLRNLNVSGNITGNQYYGGMWFHNDTGYALNLNQTFQKVTLWEEQPLQNGFEFYNSVEGKLELLTATGNYQVIWTLGGTGVNNHIYHAAIFVNDVIWNNTIGHTIGMQSNYVQMNGFGFIDLNKYDNVTLRIKDETGTTAGTAIHGNVNLIRVGN